MAKQVGFRRKDTQRAVDKSPVLVSNNGVMSRTNDWGLTEKQEAFARGVAKGLTLSDSYRAAYDAEGMKDASIQSEASKLLDNPRVASRVKVLIDRANEKHEVDAARIRRHVMDRLLMESVDMKSPANARIAALVALGRVDVVGMFKEQKGKEEERMDTDKLKDKLATLLKEMTGIAPDLGAK